MYFLGVLFKENGCAVPLATAPQPQEMEWSLGATH
jgi:2-hydroxychromene-2-carboxylate isomerase